jgi:predicted metal-dependent hydrolase
MSEAPDVAAAVRRGVRLFNLGRYMTAQQVFEAAWQESRDADRTFLEALVQVAAAMHLRTRRGAQRGAEHLLVRAIVALDDHRPSAHGVDVERLVADLDAFVRWLREVRRPHRLLDRVWLPRIRIA